MKMGDPLKRCLPIHSHPVEGTDCGVHIRAMYDGMADGNYMVSA